MADQRPLFWASGSPVAWRVQIGLNEKGLDYKSNLIEFSKWEHKSEEIMKLNPRGQVPTFVDNGIVVNESMAALLYLQDRYPSPSLLPATIEGRALAYQRFQETQNFAERVGQVLQLSFANPDEVPQEQLDALKAEMKLWERYLTGDGFIAGPEFSLADIAFGTFLMLMVRFGATLKGFPNLAKYAERIKARPSFVDTYPPHWKKSPGKGFLASL